MQNQLNLIYAWYLIFVQLLEPTTHPYLIQKNICSFLFLHMTILFQLDLASTPCINFCFSSNQEFQPIKFMPSAKLPELPHAIPRQCAFNFHSSSLLFCIMNSSSGYWYLLFCTTRLCNTAVLHSKKTTQLSLPLYHNICVFFN